MVINEEIIQKLKKENKHDDMYQSYYKDVYAYLKSRFPDLLDWELQETATFATHRMIVCAGDILRERDQEWQHMIRKYYEPKAKKVKRSDIYHERRQHENSEV